MKTLNISTKQNLLMGVFLGLWIFLFAYFIRPYDDGILHFDWNRISIGFSLIVIPCYFIVSLFQRWLLTKLSRWNTILEIAMIVLFLSIYLVATFIYYKSELMNGIYSFSQYFGMIMLPSSLIIAPILFLARKYLAKLIPNQSNVLTIRGENKLDVLNVDKIDLISITNAHNYVEIFFLQEGQLNSKLIRTSLKKIQDQFDFLIQVHRSHLINPIHFKSWKDSKTLQLTQSEIPVSKNYRNNVLSM